MPTLEEVYLGIVGEAERPHSSVGGDARSSAPPTMPTASDSGGTPGPVAASTTAGAPAPLATREEVAR